ncbi:hypothetical protein AGMMS49940_14610 [Spirochaetia bacterium]|nr:hypothetical protein AGMMS49940_14610 [Spirochaetia bacterium]
MTSITKPTNTEVRNGNGGLGSMAPARPPYNDASVGIIEVKSKAKTEHLEKLVTKKLPDFRTLYPHYRDYPIYLGIGSMSFDDHVLQRAHELGIGILRQKGDTIEADTGAVRAY